MTIAARLADLNITLPAAAQPVASYVSVVITGNTLYVSGQLPLSVGHMAKGILGRDVTLEEGTAAARTCAINILAQVNAALHGQLDRVERCVKLTGFVAATPDFTDHPKVINGASELMVQVLGDAGKHARAAVGVASLPLGACVEVEAIFTLRD